MFRLAALALVLSILSLPLSGQETAGSPSGETGPAFFSVALLLRTVYAGDFPWKPDWTAALPPDGFALPPEKAFSSGQALSVGKTLSSGQALSLTLVLDTETYTLRRNGQGFFEEFPFPVNGTLRGVRTDFDPSGAVREFLLDDEIPWRIEALEYTGSVLFPVSVPSLMRVFREDAVYFVLLAYTIRGFSETWFDAGGSGLAYWEANFIPHYGGSRLKNLEGADGTGAVFGEWDYDSGGNLVEIRGPRGTYSALYDRRGLPRYWERRPSPEGFEAYTLQWDEGGRLVRLSGFSGPGDENLVDFRYDYSLDEQGNWTERREIRMFPRFGILFPGPGITVKRTINYNDEGKE
ncbi:MAG: hypothetical protein LBP43_06615 [Treponema sp.]|jgi:hypothetical protein|nr:hypothetical protein [Treponema sp.]